jgi:undecaprenyl-diphosphatase
LYRLVLGRVQEEDRPNLNLALKLVVASVFTAVIGLGISSLEIKDNPVLVSSLLLVTAAILASTAWSRGSTGLNGLGWTRVIVLGIAQGIGVFPGISRSGITIGTGMLVGLDRKSAGDFSFLLSIPAVGGAFLLTLKDLTELSVSVPFSSIAAGFLAALAAGYAALRLLLWIVNSGRLWIFSIYLVPAGIWGIVHFGLRISG